MEFFMGFCKFFLAKLNLFFLHDKMTFYNDIFNCANDGVADRETDSCRISGTDDLAKSRNARITVS